MRLQDSVILYFYVDASAGVVSKVGVLYALHAFPVLPDLHMHLAFAQSLYIYLDRLMPSIHSWFYHQEPESFGQSRHVFLIQLIQEWSSLSSHYSTSAIAGIEDYLTCLTLGHGICYWACNPYVCRALIF